MTFQMKTQMGLMDIPLNTNLTLSEVSGECKNSRFFVEDKKLSSNETIKVLSEKLLISPNDYVSRSPPCKIMLSCGKIPHNDCKGFIKKLWNNEEFLSNNDAVELQLEALEMGFYKTISSEDIKFAINTEKTRLLAVLMKYVDNVDDVLAILEFSFIKDFPLGISICVKVLDDMNYEGDEDDILFNEYKKNLSLGSIATYNNFMDEDWERKSKISKNE